MLQFYGILFVLCSLMLLFCSHLCHDLYYWFIFQLTLVQSFHLLSLLLSLSLSVICIFCISARFMCYCIKLVWCAPCMHLYRTVFVYIFEFHSIYACSVICCMQAARSFAYLLASLKNATLAKTDISRWATIYHRFGAVLLMCWNKCWQLKYILTKPHQICSKTQLHQLMSVIAVAALLWVLLRSTSCALSERLEVV